MERIHQMHVVPDMLPELHPSIDLHMTVTALPQETRISSKVDKKVEPGAFLLPQQVGSTGTNQLGYLTMCNK